MHTTPHKNKPFSGTPATLSTFCPLSGPFGRRGAGLAGYRVGRVLSSPQRDELRFMRLSGGVSGVGGLIAGARKSGRG
jgi:hypothetical protein